ncbi:MAG: TrmH family RNA methyltransferase [Balneolaceae bacterium]
MSITVQQMAGKAKKTTRQILADNKKRVSPLAPHFILMAHNIRSLYNVGSLFRSADVFGIRSVFLSGFTPAPPRAEISKTALGAEETVHWRKIENPVEQIRALKTRDYRIYGLEQTVTGEFLPGHRVTAGKICLLLGNEVTGIDEELIPLVDQFVEIPQYGEKHSLNVSVAAGIALYAFLVKMS